MQAIFTVTPQTAEVFWNITVCTHHIQPPITDNASLYPTARFSPTVSPEYPVDHTRSLNLLPLEPLQKSDTIFSKDAHSKPLKIPFPGLVIGTYSCWKKLFFTISLVWMIAASCNFVFLFRGFTGSSYIHKSNHDGNLMNIIKAYCLQRKECSSKLRTGWKATWSWHCNIFPRNKYNILMELSWTHPPDSTRIRPGIFIRVLPDSIHTLLHLSTKKTSAPSPYPRITKISALQVHARVQGK